MDRVLASGCLSSTMGSGGGEASCSTKQLAALPELPPAARSPRAAAAWPPETLAGPFVALFPRPRAARAPALLLSPGEPEPQPNHQVCLTPSPGRRPPVSPTSQPPKPSTQQRVNQDRAQGAQLRRLFAASSRRRPSLQQCAQLARSSLLRRVHHPSTDPYCCRPLVRPALALPSSCCEADSDPPPASPCACRPRSSSFARNLLRPRRHPPTELWLPTPPVPALASSSSRALAFTPPPLQLPPACPGLFPPLSGRPLST